MKIVVPMAGKGSRFLSAVDQNPEYSRPKPLINIKGKPMICWALESLPFMNTPGRQVETEKKVDAKDLILICRQDHEDDFRISDQLRKLFGEDVKIILLDHITRGAAETVLFAKDLVDPNEEVIVSDSDHYFDGKFLFEQILNKESDISGIIPVWIPPDNEPKWSYSMVEGDGLISAVGEKDKELAARGAPANIGAYYFNKWKLFTDEVEATIKENDLTGDEGKKEFYVAPVYDRLIRRGYKVIPAYTPKVWGLGTPKDVQYFESLDLW